MTTTLPDNELNKELKARLQNMEVGNEMFKFFVSRITSQKVKFYFLVTTQLNQPEVTKCGKGWRNSTEIQVTTIYPKNTGSKALMNDATDGVIREIEDFSLPVTTGLKVSTVDISVDNELVENTNSEIVYRKIVRLETLIN